MALLHEKEDEHTGMALLYEKEDDHNHKDKSRNKVQRTDTRQNLKSHIPLVSL